MKRNIITIALVALICGACAGAQEFSTGISSGGFWALEQNYGEGYGEFCFPIIETKNGFLLRDSVTIGGFGEGTGIKASIVGVTLGNKVLFGEIIRKKDFIIWDIDSWSIAKQTIIHFVIITVSVFIVSWICSWMPHNLKGVALWCLMSSCVYLIIWLITYFSYKSKVKAVNKSLQELNHSEK